MRLYSPRHKTELPRRRHATGKARASSRRPGLAPVSRLPENVYACLQSGQGREKAKQQPPRSANY
jgi:hypothetical protein